MNGQISHSGDDLVRRVPLLGVFQDDLAAVLGPLADIAACRWAAGAPGDDRVTHGARAAVHGVVSGYVMPTYVGLGESVGLQADKLDVVRRIGDDTEAGNGELAGGWGGGRH